MGKKANRNYTTNLLLENIAYTFERNLDFTADGKSYWFQRNESSEVTDWPCPRKNSPRNFAKAAVAEIDAESIDATWTTQRCRYVLTSRHLKSQRSLKLQKGSQVPRDKPPCSLSRSTATLISQMNYWQFFGSATVRQTKPKCSSSHSKHLDIPVL